MRDLIDREAALNCFHSWVDQYGDVYTPDDIPEYQAIEALPPVEAIPVKRKMSNNEWIDFLVSQFDVSRTSAKEMLHGMMRWKKEDNFKKQFNGRRQG